jgi:uncharacterized SAM-binding protein YcdF (DUF218 family)
MFKINSMNTPLRISSFLKNISFLNDWVFQSRGSISSTLLSFLMLLCATIYFSPETVLPPIAKFFVVSEEPSRADGIVVLLGGDSPDRIQRAYELYQRGLAPRIIFGKGFIDQEALERMPKNFRWIEPGTRYVVALRSLQVPDTSVEEVDTSDAFDTSSELTKIAIAARERGYKKLLLVSSASHMRRVTKIWKRVAPDIEGIPVAADDSGVETWWKDGRWIRALGYEAGAYVKELVRSVM